MAYLPLLTEKQTFWTSAGAIASGYKLFIYLAGTTTKATTYQETTGTANTNPVVLNSRGEVPYGVYVAAGSTYKLVLAPSTDSDPPVAAVWTRDNLSGTNDTTVTVDQWQASGFTPTYVSATSFTVTGDRTSTFQVGRRVKTTNTGGTIYSTITASAYSSVTTVTVVNDSGTLDSGLSAVSVGLLTATNPSLPIFRDTTPIAYGSSDFTKKLRVEVDGFTTGNTRVMTPPDYDHRVMSQTKGSDVASAGTLNLDTATGDLVDVTGTTSITAITLAEGKSATVRFTGALTLTHGASLVIPGAKNITTVAGDIATFRGYASSVVRLASYQKFPGIVAETAVASTSGTTVDFTSIPSGVRRITIMMSGVSTSGTSVPLVQIGDSGGIENSGYLGTTSVISGVSASTGNISAGFDLAPTWGASNTFGGSMTLDLINPSTNTWTARGMFGLSSAGAVTFISGSKPLSAELDRVRITATNGTDTFDAGTINITYER
jgi:hypothetical protein